MGEITRKPKEYEVECEICGTWFTAQKSNRKYCDKCQKNSEKERYYIERSIELNKWKMGDDYVGVDIPCPICGKLFTVPKKYKERQYLCCSYECRQIYKEKEKTNPVHITPKKNIDLETFTCLQCGKEFQGRAGRKFCSNACFGLYSKEHNTKISTVERVQGDIKRICKVCGKEFIVHKDKPTYLSDLPNCCSKECIRACCKKAGSKRAQQTSNKRQSEMNEKYKIDGLCGYCKTSYKDCERMQSNFRVIPKGARFNNNGKIISCPKFSEIRK